VASEAAKRLAIVNDKTLIDLIPVARKDDQLKVSQLERL
jgi:hypothetical protein